MPGKDRLAVRDGAILIGAFTGLVGYEMYRQQTAKEFLRSEGHYRFSQHVTNATPWKQMYFTWWRMPEEEWTVYHRFKPYFLEGQLDLSKEVLIPATRVVNGIKQEGFDVLNPVYCYEAGRISQKDSLNGGGDPIKIDRAAIIVNRGWIPAAYRDKRSRP